MDLEELKEFERAIVAGEINDFKFYFEQAEDEDDIRAMRKICIENNVYKKAYPDWAEEFVFTDDYDMQYLLLDANECLDILICSENKEVRREVVEKDIEYAFEDHIMEYDQDIIMENLMNAIEPHAELLDTFLEYNDGSWDLRALELKQKARNIVPTTIEKTMSPAQLFATNHPAWAKTYYPETIAALCAIVRTLTNMGYQNRADYADIVLNMVDDYQNEDYHYLQEFHSDAILEVKDRLGYPLLN